MVSTKEIFYVGNRMNQLEREIMIDDDITYKEGYFNHHMGKLQEELIKRDEGSDMEIVVDEIRIINSYYNDCKRRTK